MNLIALKVTGDSHGKITFTYTFCSPDDISIMQ